MIRENLRSSIIKDIDSRDQQLIDLAKKLVLIKSENPPGDESSLAEFIKNFGQKWGLGRPVVISKEKNRPNIFFTLGKKNSSSEKSLVLNAHMDTKPIGDRDCWNYDPEDPVIKDGRLYGRGSTDMKGAIAAIIAASSSILRKKIPLKGQLILIFSADEEAGSAFGARVITEKGLDADAILIAEPSGIEKDFDSLGIACRGALLGKIVVHGTQMHSSISDKGGCINASVKMAEVMIEFARNLKNKISYEPHYLYPDGPTVNPGVTLKGGIFYGVIPGEASFGFDIRTIPGMEHRKLENEIKDFLKELMQKDSELKAELIIEKPPLNDLLPAEINKDHELVKACAAAAREVLGFEPQLMGVPFSTDAIYYTNQLKIPTIPSFGPGLIKLAHSPDEYINIKAVLDAAKIFAITALKYLNPDLLMED